jgi:hypothetical protein
MLPTHLCDAVVGLAANGHQMVAAEDDVGATATHRAQAIATLLERSEEKAASIGQGVVGGHVPCRMGRRVDDGRSGDCMGQADDECADDSKRVLTRTATSSKGLSSASA